MTARAAVLSRSSMRLRMWLRGGNILPKRRTVPRVIPRRAARHLPAAWRCRVASASFTRPTSPPIPRHGIGRWSADDFWRSMHDGVRRDGSQLYPAMPYTSYRGMTRDDADAVYAYLMHLRPMNVANRGSGLAFPFNIRLGMRFWNLLFLTDSIPAASTGNSAAWQRGRYVVNVLGHCGECHTPRGPVGEMRLSRPLTGFALGRVAAPDITPAGLTSRGWTAETLSAFPGARTFTAGLGVQRHAPGGHAQHPASDRDRSPCRRDLSTWRQVAGGYGIGRSHRTGCRAGRVSRIMCWVPWSRRPGHTQYGCRNAREHHCETSGSAQPDCVDIGWHSRTELSESAKHAGDAGFCRDARRRTGGSTGELSACHVGWSGE